VAHGSNSNDIDFKINFVKKKLKRLKKNPTEITKMPQNAEIANERSNHNVHKWSLSVERSLGVGLVPV
jgi:hypothetical protein